MSTSPPSQRLIPVLHAIEMAVAVGYKVSPGLRDKDIEFVYEAFHKFFKEEARGKEAPEPQSTSKGKDNLIDLIFQFLEQAEDDGNLEELTDGSYAPAGRPLTNAEEIYVVAFNYLRKSVRLWRKNKGERGYLRGPIRDLGEVIIDRDSA